MRPPLFLLLVLVAGLMLVRESGIEPLGRLEASFPVWLNANAGRVATPAPLVLVEITPEDLPEANGHFSPMEYALFINAALHFQPAVVAIEPMLSWESPDPQGLTMLRNQLLRAPKSLLGAQLQFSDESGSHPALPRELPVLTEVVGEAGGLRDFSAVMVMPPQAIRENSALGIENLNLGVSGSVRRIPLVYRYCGKVVPSFVLEAAMLYFGVTPKEVVVTPGISIALGEKATIPINEHGEMLVRFSIPITRFSFGDLLLAAEQAQAKQTSTVPVEKIPGSLVLLSNAANLAPVLQFADRPGTRGELFGHAIATIQAKEFVRQTPDWVSPLLIVGALGLASALMRASFFTVIGVAVGIAAVYLLLALALFASSLLVLPLVLPLGLVVVILLLRLVGGRVA